jgi:hypothetical protein
MGTSLLLVVYRKWKRSLVLDEIVQLKLGALARLWLATHVTCRWRTSGSNNINININLILFTSLHQTETEKILQLSLIPCSTVFCSRFIPSIAKYPSCTRSDITLPGSFLFPSYVNMQRAGCWNSHSELCMFQCASSK